MAKHKAEMTRGTTTHVHNHQPNPAGVIVSVALIGLVGIFLAWHAGIYLLDLAGARQPRETMAQIILWTGGLLFAGWLLTLWFDNVMDKYFAHQKAMANARIDEMRYRSRLAHSMAQDSRLLGEEQRFTALVYAVLLTAYDHQVRNGHFRGTYRPWSRRSAGGQILYSLGEQEPVGEAMGARVAPWLEEREIIKGDQLNLERFPDIASVQRLLYAPPIVREPNRYLGQGGEGATEWSNVDD